METNVNASRISLFLSEEPVPIKPFPVPSPLS